MATTSVTFRIDETLKRQAEALFEDMGLNMTTALTVFVKAAVRQGRIPFELSGNILNAGTAADSEDLDATAARLLAKHIKAFEELAK